MMLISSLSVNISLPFKGNLDSEYATNFIAPLIYSISGPYYSSIGLHLCILLVFKNFTGTVFIISMNS